jgi:hypothetical protein
MVGFQGSGQWNVIALGWQPGPIQVIRNIYQQNDENEVVIQKDCIRGPGDTYQVILMHVCNVV